MKAGGIDEIKRYKNGYRGLIHRCQTAHDGTTANIGGIAFY